MAGVEGNVIIGNFVVGNPPVQFPVSSPGTSGVDIRNAAAGGSNVVQGNVCLTPVNAVCSLTEDARVRR